MRMMREEIRNLPRPRSEVRVLRIWRGIDALYDVLREDGEGGAERVHEDFDVVHHYPGDFFPEEVVALHCARFVGAEDADDASYGS